MARIAPPARAWVAAAILPAALFLANLGTAADPAPAPRPVRLVAVKPAARPMTAAEIDKALMAEAKDKSELMKNLEYLSDVIGPRVTGSKGLKKANDWTAEKMKEYGLENVRLEPWEVPVGWERGTASMKLVSPDTGVKMTVAAKAWTPGLKDGKVTGEVVILRVRSKDDLAKYKGKLKNAVVMASPPATIAPVTDMTYGPVRPAPKKAEPKKEPEKKADAEAGGNDAAPDDDFNDQPEPKKQPDPKKEPEKKDDEPKKKGRPPFGGFGLGVDLNEFLRSEGVACTISDSAKPHGLLVMYGQWRPGDRATPQDVLPNLLMAHEHYAMLWRLAGRTDIPPPKVEVEITNTFVPGPITVYNTVGEVKGSEKPDEFVVVGAHLDSWDLGSGTTDNGTGSCVVLETARVIAKMAKEGKGPKRTIRFCLFSGEEQGLYGSKEYVKRHAEEMAKTSAALVHDTGTGKVIGFGLHNRVKVQEVLDKEFVSLKDLPEWNGTDLGYLFGSDHQSFDAAGVPGFACRQEADEYRLTHHTQTDTFDHAKGPNLVQGSQVMAVAAVRIANLPELLPRERGARPAPPPKKDEPKKDEKKP
jgi:hypothetical protein